MADRIELEILDEPTGKARARVVHGHAFTPKKTVQAESHVRGAWLAAGRPTMPEATALRVDIRCSLTRPAAHRKKDGTLTTAGQRSIRPLKKPDTDNIAKLILDALEGYAYPSDAAVVTLNVSKWWALRGEHARSLVVIETA